MMRSLRTPTIVAATLLAWPAVHGCAGIDGGAIEASWDVRTVDGNDTQCGDAGVSRVQLWWRIERDDGAITVRNESFPCKDERGVTGFDLPPGPAELWLEPVCADGVAPLEGTYEGPTPIVRTITQGEVITLDTQLLQVTSTRDCAPEDHCTCRGRGG